MDGESDAARDHKRGARGKSGQRMAARIVGVDQMIRDGFAEQPRQGCRSRCEARERRLNGQRRPGSRQQALLDAKVAERAHQQQNLMLAAAHPSAGIDVQNAHESSVSHSSRSHVTAGRHLAGLGVFQVVVKGGHVRDGQPFVAILESAFEEIRVEKCPGRI